ncbi:MAG: MgtC/SapB family protein [Patescibacteria group bacterium]
MEFSTAYLSPESLDLFTKLSVALILGVVLGLERVVAHKTAGMRTYALVSMGSALFVVVSNMAATIYGDSFQNSDPLRMVSQIVLGVGFLGAGLIVFKDSQLQGLTTAGGLWVAAGIGAAAGFGFYNLAVIATVLTLFVFVGLWFVESGIKKFLKD